MEKNERKNADGAGMASAFLKQHIADGAAYGGLALTMVLFLIFGSGNLMYNVSSVLQTASIYAILSLGAVFVYAMGYMDISVGQQIGVYVIILIQLGNRIGGVPGLIVGFLVILALALVCGAFNGAIAVWLNLPSIVTSLFLMFIFGGIQSLLMEQAGSNTIYIEATVKPSDRMVYSALLGVIILVVALIAWYFFRYTKLGKYTRAIGANENTTRQCGVNTTKWKVIAYMAFGVCVAIASYTVMMRTGNASTGTGSGYAMDVMICLILGGMPLNGGMRSRISSALIGTFTYVLLTNDLTTMGVPLNIINFVKAIVFIIIIFITCRSKEKILPR